MEDSFTEEQMIEFADYCRDNEFIGVVGLYHWKQSKRQEIIDKVIRGECTFEDGKGNSDFDSSDGHFELNP